MPSTVKQLSFCPPFSRGTPRLLRQGVGGMKPPLDLPLKRFARGRKYFSYPAVVSIKLCSD